jgi:hypothetical protein
LITKIPFPILEKLLCPEFQMGFRLPSTTWMLMPEAPMHKNDFSQPGENHIRNPGKVACVESVSEPHAVYQTADNHLWTGIRTFDAGHSFTAFLFGEIIHGPGRS